MQSLQFLIDTLTKGRNLHISILDTNGILNTPLKKIDFKNVIHSKSFCDVAKSTEKGYRLCMHCKKIANNKAIKEQKSFCGHCAYGLFEASMPVIIGDTVIAVVYVGNAITDIDFTKRKIDRACHHTNVNSQKLYEQLKECEYIDHTTELMGIAEIVCDYIKMLYRIEPKASTRLHWLVAAIKQHAEQTFCFNPTLNELSILYHKNEKYIGRLFKKETGISFHQYCLLLRLQKAESLLLKTSDKIIDIALECGFDNVSYFNRAFKTQYGMSPRAYIIAKKKNGKYHS